MHSSGTNDSISPVRTACLALDGVAEGQSCSSSQHCSAHSTQGQCCTAPSSGRIKQPGTRRLQQGWGACQHPTGQEPGREFQNKSSQNKTHTHKKKFTTLKQPQTNQNPSQFLRELDLIGQHVQDFPIVLHRKIFKTCTRY